MARGFPTPRWRSTIRSKVKQHCRRLTWISGSLGVKCFDCDRNFPPASPQQGRRLIPSGEHDGGHLHHPGQQGAHVLWVCHGEDCSQHAAASRHHHSRVGHSSRTHWDLKTKHKSWFCFVDSRIFSPLSPSLLTGSACAARSPSAVCPRGWSSRAATRSPWSTKTQRKPPARPSSRTPRGASVSRPNQETTAFRWGAGGSEPLSWTPSERDSQQKEAQTAFNSPQSKP